MNDQSLIGTLFAGRFRISSLLGSGGMGAVYLANHEVLQRRFAIKVIHKSLLGDLNIAARFRREARAASRIEHPHITQVTDFGHTDEGRPYLAMEYVEGPTLSDVLQKAGPFLPVPRVLNILAQIAEALVAAHAGDVVHRDLKPRNVLLTTHREQVDYVKVLDFGLAKILGVATASLTRDGETFGTPEYMSPEQCMGAVVDQRADIYSFGIVAFELMVGSVPFAGRVLTKIMAAHIQEDPPVPSEACSREDIPSTVDQMILRCIAKTPEERYQNATTLLDAIQDIQVSSGSAAIVPPKTVHPLVQRRSKTGDYVALSPTLPPRRGQKLVDDPSDWREPTESDWPAHGDVAAGSQRSRALEDLAYAVRDRGIGSPEISQVLSFKLEAQDRALDLQSDIALAEANSVEMETKARERESRLKQALNQLEHERAMWNPEKTLPWGTPVGSVPTGTLGELKVHIKELAKRIQQIGLQLEADLAVLRRQKEQQQQTLEQLCHEADGREKQLVQLLQQTRPQVMELADPDLARLVFLAGL